MDSIEPCDGPQNAVLSMSMCIPLKFHTLQIWDTFMDSIEPFARHIPYHVGVGNHGAF